MCVWRNLPLYYSILQSVSGGQYKNNPSDYIFEPLVWFFLRMMQEALEGVKVLRERYKAMMRLSEGDQRVLSLFKSSPEKRLSVSELIKGTGIERRSVQNALVKLVKAGFLQRLGVGPSSRYQLIF